MHRLQSSTYGGRRGRTESRSQRYAAAVRRSISRPLAEVVRFRIALLLMNAILVGHHVRAGTALGRAIRQGRSPHVRVERSESLDEREASARISGVMAVVDFAVSLRTAAVKNQRMVRATTRDRLRGPLRRCV